MGAGGQLAPRAVAPGRHGLGTLRITTRHVAESRQQSPGAGAQVQHVEAPASGIAAISRSLVGRRTGAHNSAYSRADAEYSRARNLVGIDLWPT